MRKSLSDHLSSRRRARPPADYFEEAEKQVRERADKITTVLRERKAGKVTDGKPPRRVLDEADAIEDFSQRHGVRKTHGIPDYRSKPVDEIPWVEPADTHSTSITPARHSSSHDYRGGHKHHVACYHSHLPLLIPVVDKLVWGGSCHSPVKTDADIYVGLDHGMHHTDRRYPWNPGHEVHFPIPDMGIPKNPEAFHKLVGWLSQRLRKGDAIHIGCIGGHGRTGMLLSALVATVGQTPDAITYVREHYCKKAVESYAQIEFLAERFGVKRVTASKGAGSWGHSHSPWR